MTTGSEKVRLRVTVAPAATTLVEMDVRHEEAAGAVRSTVTVVDMVVCVTTRVLPAASRSVTENTTTPSPVVDETTALRVCVVDEPVGIVAVRNVDPGVTTNTALFVTIRSVTVSPTRANPVALDEDVIEADESVRGTRSSDTRHDDAVLDVRVPGFRLRSVKVMAHVIGPDGIWVVVVKEKVVVVVVTD